MSKKELDKEVEKKVDDLIIEAIKKRVDDGIRLHFDHQEERKKHEMLNKTRRIEGIKEARLSSLFSYEAGLGSSAEEMAKWYSFMSSMYKQEMLSLQKLKDTLLDVIKEEIIAEDGFCAEQFNQLWEAYTNANREMVGYELRLIKLKDFFNREVVSLDLKA